MKKISFLIIAALSAFWVHSQTVLPFTEDFENIGSTTTFTSSTTSINGLSEWSYENTNRGRLRFKAGASFSNSGSAAATMDASTGNQYSTNYLILTLDLSNYTTSDLELSFSFLYISDESNNEDRVWVRGDNTKSWVEIYDWYDNRTTAGNWKNVRSLDIDATLAAANQTVGKTFQVRFGQRDNYPATSTTRDDGVIFDDIEIVERFNRDGIITDVSDICPGSNTFQATLYNDGLDTIKTAAIDWLLNNNTYSSGKFSGSLAPGSSTIVTLGVATALSGNNDLLVVCDSINGKTDQNRNDTLKLSKSPGLSGKYTVGGSSPDYTSPSAAIADLTSRGVCGAVTFEIANGSYSGSLYIPSITGASKTNTITFEGQDSSRTIITHSGGAFEHTINMDGAEWINFKDLKLQNTRSSDAWVCRLYNKCDNINFNNCWISTSTSGTNDLIGIVASASSSTENTAGENVNNLVVNQCRFSGGERGLEVLGDATLYASGNEVTNCIFDDISYAGIYFRYQSDLTISENSMKSFRSSGSDVVLLYNVNNFHIEKNDISSRDYGVYISDGNIGGSGKSKVQNNMIAAGGHGLYINTGRSIVLYHNTIVGDPALRFNDHQNIEVVNNIVYGNSGYAIFSPADDGFDVIQWNQYYSTNTNKFLFDNTNFTSLASWQTSFPLLNANSIEKQPVIVSTSNLYLRTAAQAERAPSIGIKKDIDSEDRCDIAVSIGADESKYPDAKPKARFSLADSSYKDALVSAVHNNGSAVESYAWYVDGSLADSASSTLNHRFTTSGRHKITLYAYNCGGFDTLSKFIKVVPVTAAVVPNFTVVKKVVEVGEATRLINKSTNGPSTIFWSVSPYWMNKKTRSHYFNTGFDSTSVNTELVFNQAGDYTVCLYAKNSLGGGTTCKQFIISVRDNALICGNSDVSEALYGTIKDPGGDGNYQGFRRYNCNYTITPCARNLKLKFIDFDLNDNRDYLKIYNGTDNSAPAIHSYHSSYVNGLTGDNTSSNFKDSIYARSGEAYMEFTTNSFTGGRGFEIEWTGTRANVAPPTADFDIPDTICTNTEMFIENRSSGQGNSYYWLITASVTNDVELTDSAVSNFFFFAGKYTVMLVASNCGGTDTMVKQIRVVDAPAKPVAKVDIDIPNPDVGQVVTLSDISAVSGYQCSDFRIWRITPAAKVTYINSTNSQSQVAQVVFSDTGCYNVRLIASNSQGRDTIDINCAVRVIDRCVPKVSNLDADVGIARVVMGTINNSSATGDKAYNDYRADHQTEVIPGAYYDLSIYRASRPQNFMNRKVWIDYNNDGDFTDPGEEVVADTLATKTVRHDYRIKIKDTNIVGARTMRIGVSKNLSSNTPCGTNVNGEFEDYRLNFIRDNVAPVIYLNSLPDTTIAQCNTWIDPMGYALDNAQEDTIKITSSGAPLIHKVGDYFVTYRAADSSGNVAFATRKVTVSADTIVPVIILYGADTIYHEVGSAFTDPGADYIDNCGIKDSIYTSLLDVNVLGTYTITYEAIDSMSNSRKVVRIVIVRDTRAPSLSLIGADTILHQLDSVFNDPGIIYTDNYDPKDSLVVNVKGSVDVNTIGDYTLWYIVRDKSGNTDSIYRIVKVGDYLTPKITLLGSLVDTLDVFDFHIDSGVVYTNHNGDTAGLTLSYGGTYVDNFGYEGQATQVGLFTLVYTVTNKLGSKSTETRYILVLDRVAPDLILLGDNPYIMYLGDTYNEPGWQVSDNYWSNNEVWVYTYGSIKDTVIGTFELFYYAADSSSNITDTLIRQVIVKDTAVGLVSPNEANVYLYPNPNNGSFTLELSGWSDGVTYVQVFDPLGKVVYNSHVGNREALKELVTLNNAVSGAYMLIIQNNDQVIRKTFIVR